MRMMPHAVPCEWAQEGLHWIEHESVYLACEDSPQRAFSFAGFLPALMASFVHWLCCFLISVANHRLRSALNSAKICTLWRTSHIVFLILHCQEAPFFPVLDLHRQCTIDMSYIYECTWCMSFERARECKLTFLSMTDTYVCTRIQCEIDPSFKASG